jgi:(p)ppGpp synthase/HD superfamily hydrolase
MQMAFNHQNGYRDSGEALMLPLHTNWRLAMTNNAIANATTFAKERHGNQMYGDQPYWVHLDAVEAIVDTATFLFAPNRGSINHMLRVAAILHDVLEDTDTTFEELKEKFGLDVATIVRLVTNPKTGTRKEKHEATYPLIALNEHAVIVKLADRLANVESGGKRDMYRKEYPYFREMMTQYLDTFTPEGYTVICALLRDLDFYLG